MPNLPPIEIDSNLTLKENEDLCEKRQNLGLQLKRIKFDTVTAEGNVFQVNRAEFVTKRSGRLKNLFFVEVGTKDPETLKKEKKTDGWTYVCGPDKIFVKNSLTDVMVFGKTEAEA